MRTLLLIPLLVFAFAVGFASPARATAPTEGSGAFTITTVSVTTLGHVDGNTVSSITQTEARTGFTTGACPGALTEVIHPDGSANLKGSETCTGTAAGRPGTFRIDFVGTGTPAGSFHFIFVMSGMGTLADLHGTGTGQSHLTSTGSAGTYTEQVHFDS
ncbi:MAG TPA: DUF3224 domain-containing protein [Chloroflexota bacterium]|nr:DUF3224 domain-containing protein [Chloroflexota bacterium]